MTKFNTFEPGWFHKKDCQELTTSYYLELRIAVGTHGSKAILGRCQKCGIDFLTPIQNRGQSKIRCPTGCRQQRESESSVERSTAYYETEQGRVKKKAHNRRRSLKAAQEKNRQISVESTNVENMPPLLRYYGWIIHLVDGVRMNDEQLKEVCEVIRTKVRQRGRVEYGDMHYICDD